MYSLLPSLIRWSASTALAGVLVTSNACGIAEIPTSSSHPSGCAPESSMPQAKLSREQPEVGAPAGHVNLAMHSESADRIVSDVLVSFKTRESIAFSALGRKLNEVPSEERARGGLGLRYGESKEDDRFILTGIRVEEIPERLASIDSSVWREAGRPVDALVSEIDIERAGRLGTVLALDAYRSLLDDADQKRAQESVAASVVLIDYLLSFSSPSAWVTAFDSANILISVLFAAHARGDLESAAAAIEVMEFTAEELSVAGVSTHEVAEKLVKRVIIGLEDESDRVKLLEEAVSFLETIRIVLNEDNPGVLYALMNREVEGWRSFVASRGYESSAAMLWYIEEIPWLKTWIEAELKMLAVASEAEQIRAATGSYPESIEELGHVGVVASQAGIRFVNRADGPLIYALGIDDEDNGGKSYPFAFNPSDERSFGTDFVLRGQWPVWTGWPWGDE